MAISPAKIDGQSTLKGRRVFRVAFFLLYLFSSPLFATWSDGYGSSDPSPYASCASMIAHVNAVHNYGWVYDHAEMASGNPGAYNCFGFDKDGTGPWPKGSVGGSWVCPTGSTGTPPSCVCSGGGNYDSYTNTCPVVPPFDCSGQPGTYADCGSKTCKPVPQEPGPPPPDPTGVPYPDSTYSCQPGESAPYCTYGDACTSGGGILASNEKSSTCYGMPTTCTPDSPAPPVPPFNNKPAPDFPEKGRPCAEVQPGYVICAKDSPDKPPGTPDGHYDQGNDGQPGGGPGQPGDNTGTGNGDTTHGDGYDDDNGDGKPDGNTNGGPDLGTTNALLGAIDGRLGKIDDDINKQGGGNCDTCTGQPNALDKGAPGQFSTIERTQARQDAEAALTAKINQVKTEFKSMSLQYTGITAQLPIYDFGVIKGHAVSVNLNNHASELALLGYAVVFFAWLVAVRVIFL